MEEKQFDQQQSLELIAQMIRSARERLERRAGRPFLIWGYTTVATSLAVWAGLNYTQDVRWNWLWLAIVVIGMFLMMWLQNKRHAARRQARTFVDRVIVYIWTVFGIGAVVAAYVGPLLYHGLPVLFSIALLMGMGTALTGLVIRFTPCVVAGFAGMALSLLFLVVAGPDSCLIFAALFAVMMVVPGHILDYRSTHPRTSAGAHGNALPN